MNLSDMRDELLLRLGNVTSLNSTRLTLLINLAYKDVAMSYEFPQLKQMVTASLQQNDWLISLPSDCFAIYSVKNQTNGGKIVKSSDIVLDNLAPGSTGPPEAYRRIGNMLELWPPLDQAYTILLTYCRYFNDLSQTTDSPLISPVYHEAILMKATAKGFRALFEYQKAREVDNEFVAFMRSRVYEGDIEDSDNDYALEVITERYQ